MNKEKVRQYCNIYLEVYNKYLLWIGLALICIGMGAAVQAQHDTIALNESLYNIAINDGVLYDGTTYYYIGLYQNKANFDNMTLINISQCELLKGK